MSLAWQNHNTPPFRRYPLFFQMCRSRPLTRAHLEKSDVTFYLHYWAHQIWTVIHTSSWGWCEICWRAPGMSVVQISCLVRCANTSGGQKSNSEGVIQSNALAAQRRGTESDVRRPHGGCSLLARLWNHVLVHHFHKIVVYCEFNCLQPTALLTSRCLWNTGKGYWVIAYWILIVCRVWPWDCLKIWIWCREKFCDLSRSDPARQ